jgi:hypothetical protein
MNCQYCGSKLDATGKCPVCGKENKQKNGAQESRATEAQGKKLNKGRVILTSAIALVLVAAIVVGIGGWVWPAWWKSSKKSDKGTSETTLQDEDGFGNTKVTAKDSYATTTAEPGDAAMTSVVAKYDGGEMTDAELNIYFWMEYYNFMSSYGSYASMLGLDTTLPLDQQDSMAKADENDENSAALTWEQYFLSSAVENYTYYKGLELAANAAGYKIDDEYQSDLDSLSDSIKSEAESNGFDSAEAYLQNYFGSGVTMEDYVAYMTTYYTAYSYYTNVLGPQCDPTDAEIEAYFEENADNYDFEKSDLTDVQVRQILIAPEKDTDSDGDGTNDESSDAAWAAAEEKANQVYAEWQENPTEDNFATLAGTYSSDTGSNTNGGLYDDVYPGEMVTEFNDWCF